MNTALMFSITLVLLSSCGTLSSTTAVINIKTEDNSCWTLKADTTTQGCGSDLIVIGRSMNNRFEALISKDSDDGVLLEISLIVDDQVVSTAEMDWYNLFGRTEYVGE